MTRTLVDQSVIARAPDQPWCDLGEEIVVLRVRDSAYYRLKETGRAIWLLLERPRTVAEIVAELGRVYDGAPDTMAAEIRPFLAHCSDIGLMATDG